jgi:hypothetical protein
MRAKEFIIERSFSKRASGPMSTTYQFPTMPSANAYAAYRFGLAMADHTIDYAEGPTGNSAVIVAYTPEEEEIIKSGTRQTGHKGRIVADRSSHETTDTNSVSPIAKLKRNRYGV